VRHMEMGKPPYQAAMDGAKEIGFTIISMTLSLAAVFIPVIFMSGIIGRLLNEFAVTIAVAILVSGFVSLSLTPMLCSRFLHHTPREEHGALYRSTERLFDGLLQSYEWSLKKVLQHRALTVMASLVVFAATFYLFGAIPKGFLPNEDIGRIAVSTE